MTADNAAPQVFNPAWCKILGIVGLPSLALAALWLASRPLWEADLTNAQQILFPLLGLAVVYQCYIGSRCLPYLNTVVVLHEDSIEVRKGEDKTRYRWRELGVVTFSFAATTQVLTRDGATIAYFSDGIPNLDLLIQNTVSNDT